MSLNIVSLWLVERQDIFSGIHFGILTNPQQDGANCIPENYFSSLAD